MPQRIRSISPASRPAVPQPRGASRLPSPRQLREQEWTTLVSTYRLLSRLVVERTKHHLPDDADTVARAAVGVDEELEHRHPIRWPRLHAQLLLEEAGWWAEEHGDDPASCSACLLEDGIAAERIDIPPPRRARA